MLRLQRAVLLRARVPRLLPRVTRRHSTLDAPTWSLPLPEGVLGQVSELFCEPGSRVHMDETVAVIETDKLAIDVKASQSGVVSAVLVFSAALSASTRASVSSTPTTLSLAPWKNQKGSPFCNGTTLVDGPSSAATDGALSAI